MTAAAWGIKQFSSKRASRRVCVGISPSLFSSGLGIELLGLVADSCTHCQLVNLTARFPSLLLFPYLDHFRVRSLRWRRSFGLERLRERRQTFSVRKMCRVFRVRVQDLRDFPDGFVSVTLLHHFAPINNTL